MVSYNQAALSYKNSKIFKNEKVKKKISLEQPCTRNDSASMGKGIRIRKDTDYKSLPKLVVIISQPSEVTWGHSTK